MKETKHLKLPSDIIKDASKKSKFNFVNINIVFRQISWQINKLSILFISSQEYSLDDNNIATRNHLYYQAKTELHNLYTYAH